jgi:transposase-like protein
MFRNRLFGIEFKPTNTMNNQTGTQAPAQAGIEDFNGIFQERLRGIVRDGLLAMFARLKARGLKAGTARRLLLVRDGSEAIAKAVRHFWPDAVQQECLVHVERGLCGKLSWKHQKEVVERMNRLRGVQGAEAGEEAFGELLEYVRGKNLAAAEGLENRRTASWRSIALMSRRRST